ncbi:hypothetical protein [Mesorhizobium sp. ES1-1]|uniref:hypothetical protein n=1 Tax=Mesorhizobium sp. ES1-1 TaxID=2876629 RepID=UPI001CCFCB2C|nr:hypothetical protein [Mesorhizobium sp. ES1-1]MBZ9678861.1 hypothetical protein [Mesorhizobium sp. ES1-1]
MHAKTYPNSGECRFQAPQRGDCRPKLALRQRSSDHPMAMYMVLAACAFVGMAVTPTVGPAFASLTPPAGIIEGAPTTVKSARLPMPAIDFACKGQSWGAESMDCLRAIAEQPGTNKTRAIRMIANVAPLSTTPNIF